MLPLRILSRHSHLYEFISLESHRRLNYVLPVICVVLESGSVDVAERHVVLRGGIKKHEFQRITIHVYDFTILFVQKYAAVTC